MIYILPIRNTGKLQLKIEIEPEGDWFPLDPGDSCEVRFLLDNNTQKMDLELVLENELVLIYCDAEKEYWKNGKKVR